MEETKVNILGTDYIVRYGTDCKDPKLISASGYIEYYSKEIVLEPIRNPDSLTIKNHEDYNDKVLRHEITHAFLHESGMDEWAENEKLVNWIAIQMPKIAEAMIKSNCLKLKT